MLEEKSREIEAERKARKELEARVAPPADSGSAPAAVAAGEAPAPEGGAEPTAVGAGGARFFASEYDGVLAKVDWKTVGTNMREMLDLIRGLAPLLEKGEKPPAKTAGRIQELNGALVSAALAIGDKLPGTGVNGKFTSPAFTANALAAVLAAAGKPLTGEQESRIETLSRTYLANESRRLSGYDDRTWELEKILDEAESRDRYMRDVFAVLTAEQATLVSPPEVRGRVALDLFSPALIYLGRVGLKTYAKPEELATTVLNQLTSRLTLTDAQRSAAQPLAKAWVEGLPRELTGMEWNALDVQGCVTAGRVGAWGRQWLGLLHTLSDRLGLDEGQLATLRSVGQVMVGLAEEAKRE
jgi:hypothetical protein